MDAASSGRSRVVNGLSWALFMAVLAVVVYVRVRLLSVPLERDEGEFAYVGQLLLHGSSPFAHAYSMKVPGVGAVYAIFMFFFGETGRAVHLGLLLISLASSLLVLLVGTRLYAKPAALAAAGTYALLSVSDSVLGFAAHATHFVVFFSLGGFYLLQRYLESRHRALLFAAGALFGMAFVMKQHALFLVLFAIAYLVGRGGREEITGRFRLIGVASFLVGAALPYLAILVFACASGQFETFALWTVKYALQYSVRPSLAQGGRDFLQNLSKIVQAQPLLWILSLAGMVLLCTRHGRRVDRFFLFGLAVASFLTLCPGLVFRQHYFLTFLPVTAFMVGACVSIAAEVLASSATGAKNELVGLALIALATAGSLYTQRGEFFRWEPLEVSRRSYGLSPFPEAALVSNYLKEHTEPGDRIAVLGSEPEILFLAQRPSATGFIYMYGLMEEQPYAARMQQQMVDEIQANRPKYVVFVNVRTSWLVRAGSPATLLTWAPSYLRQHYECVGVLDMVENFFTRSVWDDRASDYTPVSNYFITVLKRIS